MQIKGNGCSKNFNLTLKVPEKLQLYELYVYYVVHICDFGMVRVKKLANMYWITWNRKQQMCVEPWLV